MSPHRIMNPPLKCLWTRRFCPLPRGEKAPLLQQRRQQQSRSAILQRWVNAPQIHPQSRKKPLPSMPNLVPAFFGAECLSTEGGENERGGSRQIDIIKRTPVFFLLHRLTNNQPGHVYHISQLSKLRRERSGFI